MTSAAAASSSITGIDISKPAAQMASRKYGSIQFFVASTFDLPLADHRLDVCLKVCAPASVDEVRRVLKPGGFLISVDPGPRRLASLRRAMYSEVRSRTPETLAFERSGLPKPLHSSKITFDVSLEPFGVERLLEMTPHGHSPGASNLRSLSTDLTVEVDVGVDVVRIG